MPVRHALARFIEKYRVNHDTGCWEWCHAKQGGGYGLFWLEGKYVLAHRASYAFFIGPIADGLTIDHLCKSPGCVNPSHLEAVNMATNFWRGNSFASLNKRKTHCPQGHPYAGDNLVVTKEGSRQCRTCTRQRTRAWQQTERARTYHRLYARQRYQRTGHASWERTHCPQGHPYAGDNLKVNAKGHRLCRACHKQRNDALPHPS
jgi:hypothetical protein